MHWCAPLKCGSGSERASVRLWWHGCGGVGLCRHCAQWWRAGGRGVCWLVLHPHPSAALRPCARYSVINSALCSAFVSGLCQACTQRPQTDLAWDPERGPRRLEVVHPHQLLHPSLALVGAATGELRGRQQIRPESGHGQTCQLVQQEPPNGPRPNISSGLTRSSDFERAA